MAQEQTSSRLDQDRADLLEEVFVKFSNDATLLDSEQFAIDHQDKIKAYDSLIADGTLRHDSGNKLEFSLRSYTESKFWPKDEALLNQLVPIMKEMYSEKKTALFEVTDFIARIERKGIMPRVKPISIERALRLFYRVGLMGGHNPAPDEHGVPRIKSFSVSPMILRTNVIADQVQLYTQPANTVPSAMTIAANLFGTARPTLPATENNKVFIVHGHNEKVRKGVADMIGKLDLEPIVLHEKANQGLTLMEKFLKHSDVGFAIVLMTADDSGKANTEKGARPRARQNVVFEWGFFVGKLGRSRVCALYEQGIDLPSDLHGIVYIPLDAGGHWRFSVLKELKAAGYTVDANRLLED